MTVGFQQGSASGAGGSYGGLGGGAGPNPVYGVASNPNEPGSGGGAFTVPAGNGGGLIRIAATTLILNGAIRANGGPTDPGGSASGGSGGGIRIDAGTISGAGTVTANGSQGTLVGGGGGGGRVALNYQTNAGFNFSSVNAVAGSGSPAGQSGTVSIQQQIAMLVPEVQQSSSEGGQNAFDNPVRFALSDKQLTATEDSARRRAFESSIVDSPLSTNNSPENLYLAMVAEGKFKPFASTITTSQDTGVSADD
jgi:hypothetical protein